MRNTKYLAALLAVLYILVSFGHARAADKEKKHPVTQYWMSVATMNTIVPGMSSPEMSGIEGMFMGKMAGIGPKNTLRLQLNSPKSLPPSPEATHDIPPGQKMGKTLPLLIPDAVKDSREEGDQEVEKPKVRMIIYWGCGEAVRQGQPKVIDTEKMSLMEFGKALAGRTATRQLGPTVRSGWVYSDWPNKRHHQDVPQGSSLRGDHLVHGNYMPDISFAIAEKNDFMQPVEFTSVKGGLADSVRFQWKSIPTAIGYFAQAIGHSEKSGETIIWTSSEVYEPGFGLMGYLSPTDVSRFIKEKVVMPPSATNCAIPKGIFKEAGGAALQFIGYGDELNIAYPPKPKDSNKPHEYIWAMKLRNMSTGMMPLGQEEMLDERPTGKDKDEPIGKSEEEPAEKKGTINKLRGIFGF